MLSLLPLLDDGFAFLVVAVVIVALLCNCDSTLLSSGGSWDNVLCFLLESPFAPISLYSYHSYSDLKTGTGKAVASHVR